MSIKLDSLSLIAMNYSINRTLGTGCNSEKYLSFKSTKQRIHLEHDGTRWHGDVLLSQREDVLPGHVGLTNSSVGQVEDSVALL